MRVDFWEAANRHWQDAELLRESPMGWRLGGSDQLYGLAVECALKAILVWCGADRSADGDLQPRSPERTHLPPLWDAYQAFLNGKQEARYSLPAERAFDDWDVRQRYLGHASGPAHEVVEAHQLAARRIMHRAQEAWLDHAGGML